MRLLFLALVLLVMSSTLVFTQNSNDSWLGWRGFEKEGVVDSVNIPTSWSVEKSIKWKTEIPGQGHSSPVVYDDNVVVTTAYYTVKHKFWLKLVQYFEIFIFLILFATYLSLISKSLRSDKRFFLVNIFNLICFSFNFGLVIFYTLSDSIFCLPDKADHITQTYRWFYSGIIIAFCLLISSYFIKLTYWRRLVLIISLALIGVLIYILRPFSDYYSLKNDDFMFETILKSIIIPIFSAFIILVSLIYKRKDFGNEKLQLKRNIPKTLFYSSFVIIVLAFAFGLFGISIYRWLFYGVPEGNFQITSSDLYYRDGYVFLRLLILGLGLWTAAYILKLTKGYFPNSKIFAFGILLLAFLVFVEKNYLMIEKEYVRAVLCIDKDNGEIKWKKEMFGGDQGPLHPDNSPASPTPIINGNYIYAYFGSPGLVCLDLYGNIIWENTDLKFDGIHGVGASPMFSDGMIIIQSEMAKDPYITAIDGKTGKAVWKKQRKSHEGIHGEHRTPTIISLNGQKIFVTWGKSGLITYELKTGNLLNNIPLNCTSIKEHVTSIISSGDSIFAVDYNYFHTIDLAKLILDDDSAIRTITIENKGPNCSSPVYYDGLIFMISDNGFASCYDTRNGKLLWQEKLNGIYLASATLINDKVYFSNTSGLTTVVKAKREFKKLTENKLPEGIYASFAPLQNEIIIRTTVHLWCVSAIE